MLTKSYPGKPAPISSNYRRPARLLLVALLGLATLVVRGDEFDTIRENWRLVLTGGNLYDRNDPDFSWALGVSTNDYDTMVKSANRTFLWSDLANGKTHTAPLMSTAQRLRN